MKENGNRGRGEGGAPEGCEGTAARKRLLAEAREDLDVLEEKQASVALVRRVRWSTGKARALAALGEKLREQEFRG